MADEGLHEIQLNGKQLVFLFMASTVVAVVIFLCGVMVGRGVRAQQVTELTEASADTGADPTVVTSTPARATNGSLSSSDTPVAPRETLTYPNRLEGLEPPEETLKEPVAIALSAPAKAGRAVSGQPDIAPVTSPPPTSPSPTSSPVTSPQASAPSAKAAPAAVASEPAGNGFVVQVVAVNDRGEAETIARRLAGKGYPSFVAVPGGATPRMFRVRIGKFKDRREAETIATRLAREEQFKPWITR